MTRVADGGVTLRIVHTETSTGWGGQEIAHPDRSARHGASAAIGSR